MSVKDERPLDLPASTKYILVRYAEVLEGSSQICRFTSTPIELLGLSPASYHLLQIVYVNFERLISQDHA